MATFSSKPGVSADDGYFNTVSGSGYQNNATTTIFGLNGATPRSGFFRIPSVTIPRTSVISAASMTLRAKSTISVACSVTIGPEAADNPAAVSSDSDGRGRSRATAASWTVPSMTSGNDYTSADFTTGMQAVVNRAGFASGNAVQILIDEASSSDRRIVDAWNGTNLNTFDVTYTPPRSQPYGTRWDHHRANY